MASDYTYSPFSEGFRKLIYMGLWTPDMFTQPLQRKIFYVYALLCQLGLFTFITLQGVDMYLVFGDFRKMAFNLCTSGMISGIFVKMMMLLWRRGRMIELNSNLWEDLLKCKDEDLTFFDAAYKKFCFMRTILFSGPIIIITMSGILSYFSYKWGSRFLPFAGYFPMVDINNDATYVPALIFELIVGYYASIAIIESDLALIGIILQIQTHCQILNKNLTKLDDVCDYNEDGICKKEINKHLRTKKVLNELKNLVKRHLELLKYCDDVEYIFNNAMMLQLCGGSFVLVMVGVQTTRVFRDFNASVYYQTLDLLFGMIDLYVICYHFTILAGEFANMEFAIYDSRWYEMDVKVKKKLLIIMTRAQKPPKFTYGKLFIIDVEAYKALIKNMYNWLMLFRQLDMK